MTSLAAPGGVAPARPAPPLIDRPRGLFPALSLGLCLAAVAAALVVLRPSDGVSLAATVLGGGLVTGAVAVLLVRRPQLAPWPAVLLFATSAELKLRVSATIGAAKDGYVVLLVVIAVVYAVRRRSAVRRLRAFAFPGAALAVLVGLYLADPAGSHSASWLAATRLLLEVLALLGVGLVLAPEQTLRHLVAVMALAVPLEAVVAWAQQLSGVQALVYRWGYQYGAQVRISSDGSLRTSGTFEDPFQLAALAVLALALALFVATWRQAVLIIPAVVAILAATSVRTALIQSGVLLVLWAIRRGWWGAAVALAGVAALAGVFVLGTTKAEITPGAPEQSVLFSLNGRSSAWGQAVDGWESLVTGNGVGTRGTGSTVAGVGISSAPSYQAGAAPVAAYAGSSAFLDSTYAQVQSDVGIAGTAALLTALLGLGVVIVRSCRAGDPTWWAAGGVLGTAMIDWVGRSSLASYTTGFLTLYVLGILLGAARARGGPR